MCSVAELYHKLSGSHKTLMTELHLKVYIRSIITWKKFKINMLLLLYLSTFPERKLASFYSNKSALAQGHQTQIFRQMHVPSYATKTNHFTLKIWIQALYEAKCTQKKKKKGKKESCFS